MAGHDQGLDLALVQGPQAFFEAGAGPAAFFQLAGQLLDEALLFRCLKGPFQGDDFLQDAVGGIGGLGPQPALEPFPDVGMQDRLDLAHEVVGTAQDEAVETVLLENVECFLGGFFIMVMDRGVDVPFHAPRLLPLSAAFDFLGDIRLHFVEQRDLAHKDFVPFGFATVDEECDQLVEFIQNEGQGPDEGVGVEDNAAAWRLRQG